MPYSELRIGRYSEPGREYFITTNIYERRPVFTDFQRARKLVNQLRLLEKNCPVNILAWVIMPDHVHLLLALTGEMTLSEVMRRFKGSSSKALNKDLNMKQFWQHSFYDHALRAEEDRRQIARYIVANPLRAGLVENIGDYPHWDSV